MVDGGGGEMVAGVRWLRETWLREEMVACGADGCRGRYLRGTDGCRGRWLRRGRDGGGGDEMVAGGRWLRGGDGCGGRWLRGADGCRREMVAGRGWLRGVMVAKGGNGCEGGGDGCGGQMVAVGGGRKLICGV
jgi:hypothetical protein